MVKKNSQKLLSFLTSLAFSPIVLSPETIIIHEFFISSQRDSQMYKHMYVHIPSCFVHFLDFLNNSLRRYNLRTIKLAPLQCTIQWFCISQGIVQPSSWSNSGIFCSHLHPNKLSNLQQSFPSLPTSPSPWKPLSTVRLYGRVCSGLFT